MASPDPATPRHGGQGSAPPAAGAADMDQRKAYLELGQADAALLAQVHARLGGMDAELSDAFYGHLMAVPALRKLLPDANSLARLKAAQSAYFNSLTAGDYGQAYIANRLHIGRVHQRIGLSPHWYIGAYCKYLGNLDEVVRAMLGADPAAAAATSKALLKVVCFDISLALDAYIEADRAQVVQLKEYAEQIVNAMPCGVAVLDQEGRIRNMNQAVAQMFALDHGAPGTSPLALQAGEAALEECIARSVASGARQSILVKRGLPGATPRYLQCSSAPTMLGGEQLILLVIEDVSRHKSVEEDLLYLARHDVLTRLPNRTLLSERLEQALVHAARSQCAVAVMFIDLDRFKNVNDSLGHDAGDKVIKATGARLAAQVRHGDTVARLGGDEFVVVLADMARADDVAKMAVKIMHAICQPIELDRQDVALGASIGISLFPKDGSDAQTLLMNADAAMYRAKDGGRGNFQFYAQDMHALALARVRLEGGLRNALEREEFVLHYQPQFDLGSGRLVGVEALLRWQPSQRAMVLPSEFIPIAEETGLIVPIGEWVLRSACAQQRTWEHMAYPLKMAVNLSARQFQQPDLQGMVAAILLQTGCRADRLELELTESMTMKHPEAAIATQRSLAAMGVSLSIDDFGTGYSSLNTLRQFPIHALKIDQCFVRDIGSDPNGESIVRAIIALGHSLQLSVLAEGVETQAQLDFLRRHGCDQVQGYYVGRPLDAAAFGTLLARDRAMAQRNIHSLDT